MGRLREFLISLNRVYCPSGSIVTDMSSYSLFRGEERLRKRRKTTVEVGVPPIETWTYYLRSSRVRRTKVSRSHSSEEGVSVGWMCIGVRDCPRSDPKTWGVGSLSSLLVITEPGKFQSKNLDSYNRWVDWGFSTYPLSTGALLPSV